MLTLVVFGVEVVSIKWSLHSSDPTPNVTVLKGDPKSLNIVSILEKAFQLDPKSKYQLTYQIDV